MGWALVWWGVGVLSAVPLAWVGGLAWLWLAPWVAFAGFVGDRRYAMPPPDPRLPPLTLDEVRAMPVEIVENSAFTLE